METLEGKPKMNCYLLKYEIIYYMHNSQRFVINYIRELVTKILGKPATKKKAHMARNHYQ